MSCRSRGIGFARRAVRSARLDRAARAGLRPASHQRLSQFIMTYKPDNPVAVLLRSTKPHSLARMDGTHQLVAFVKQVFQFLTRYSENTKFCLGDVSEVILADHYGTVIGHEFKCKHGSGYDRRNACCQLTARAVN